jgi:AcrR family transcriptional regulator
MENKRQKVLKAAASLFLQKGYAATTMDEIAARAGIAKGTVYLYFKDKTDLYASLLEERIGALLEELKAVAEPAAGPAERLEAMVRCNLHFIAKRYSGAEFMADLSVGHDPEMLKTVRTRFTPRFGEVLQLFAGVIRDGTEQRVFRAVDPFETAARIFGLINVNLMRRALDRKPIDPKRETAALIDLVLHGITAERGSRR